ncbi:MAG TPA: ATP-binding protein [Methanospirillum sp.]|nr:ATP-binding protein [Methanospirillum sp.]
MADSLNVIIGTDVLTYTWRTEYDSQVTIGDLIVVDDQVRSARFYARVVHIAHGNEKIHSISSSLPPDTIQTALEVRGYSIGYLSNDDIFRKPRIIPTRFSRVHQLDERDIAFLNGFMGEIEIGQVVSGHTPIPDLPVRIPAQILTQHMGVFATTGMGKSNFMKVFCASAIHERKFGMLLVDPHGEYATGLGSDSDSRGLLHHPEADEGLAVYSSRDETNCSKKRMFPLSICHNDLSITDLNLLFDLTAGEREVVNLLTPFSGKDIIDFFLNEDVDSLPSHVKTTAYIGNHQNIAQRIRSAGSDSLRVVQRQIQTLAELSSGFLDEKKTSIPSILEHLLANKVVLIDIPRMSEVTELFLLAVISRAILSTYRDRVHTEKTQQKGQILITIEEAQRVLAHNSEKTGTFREIAMEGRKFGVGLCAVTQQPKNIDPRILAQMNTYIVMGLADQLDRETIATSAKHDLHILDLEIQTLDRGDAVISTIGIPFPISCHVHRFEDYLGVIGKWAAAPGLFR